MTSQIKKLNTQYSIDQFMPDAHPLLTARDEINNSFSISINSPVLILIQEENSNWLKKEKMDQLRLLVNKIREMEHIEGVKSLANIESASEEGSEIAMGGLLELTNPEGWEQRVSSDPTLYPLLISKNFDTLVVTFTSDIVRTRVLEVIDQVRHEVETTFPQAEIRVGGVPTLQAQMAKLIGDELKLFLALALIVASLSLLFVFSSWMSILNPLFAIILSILITIECMVLFNLNFNILSATVMVFVTIIVVAVCIHTQIHYYKELQDKSPQDALKHTFSSLFVSNMLAAFTTSVGFLTLYFSEAPLIREYGLSSTLSIMVAWLVTTCYLFGYLDKLPKPKARAWVFKSTKIFDSVIQYRKCIIFAVSLFCILSLFFSKDISWESKLFDDLPSNHESRKVSEEIDKNLGGILPLDIVIQSEESGFWNEPEALKKVDALEKKWRKLEFVESVISVPELIRQSKNDPLLPIPAERSQIAEIGFMFSLAEKNPLIHFQTPDASSLRVALRVRDVEAGKVKTVIHELKRDLSETFPDLKITMGGMGNYAHELSRYLSLQLMTGFWWAMLAICIVLIIVFRSLSWTLLSTIPNFLPAIGLLGILGLTEIPIKPAIATIFSIALGIVVDNTVYILSRLKSYNSPIGQKLVKKVMKEEGVSCFISSVSLFCGFAIFLMSYFSINRYFGMFLLFSILVGLVGDLLFLPAILASLPEKLTKRM